MRDIEAALVIAAFIGTSRVRALQHRHQHQCHEDDGYCASALASGQINPKDYTGFADSGEDRRALVRRGPTIAE